MKKQGKLIELMKRCLGNFSPGINHVEEAENFPRKTRETFALLRVLWQSFDFALDRTWKQSLTSGKQNVSKSLSNRSFKLMKLKCRETKSRLIKFDRNTFHHMMPARLYLHANSHLAIFIALT